MSNPPKFQPGQKVKVVADTFEPYGPLEFKIGEIYEVEKNVTDPKKLWYFCRVWTRDKRSSKCFNESDLEAVDPEPEPTEPKAPEIKLEDIQAVDEIEVKDFGRFTVGSYSPNNLLCIKEDEIIIPISALIITAHFPAQKTPKFQTGQKVKVVADGRVLEVSECNEKCVTVWISDHKFHVLYFNPSDLEAVDKPTEPQAPTELEVAEADLKDAERIVESAFKMNSQKEFALDTWYTARKRVEKLKK